MAATSRSRNTGHPRGTGVTDTSLPTFSQKHTPACSSFSKSSFYSLWPGARPNITSKGKSDTRPRPAARDQEKRLSTERGTQPPCWPTRARRPHQLPPEHRWKGCLVRRWVELPKPRQAAATNQEISNQTSTHTRGGRVPSQP